MVRPTAVGFAGLLAAALLLGIPTGALASGVGCIHGLMEGQLGGPSGSSTGTACLDQSNGETYKGGYTEFHDLTLNVDSPSSQHVNATMWFYTAPPTYDPHTKSYYETQWVETGLRNGDGPNGNTGYAQYWAEFDSGTNEHIHAYPASPDGYNHAYEVQQANTVGKWTVYWDFNPIGTTSYQPSSWTGYQVQMGIENSDNPIATTTHTDIFWFNPMEAKNPQQTWYDFNYHRDLIMYPCNEYGVTPYWPAGKCIHWVPVNNYEFEAGKP